MPYESTGSRFGGSGLVSYVGTFGTFAFLVVSDSLARLFVCVFLGLCKFNSEMSKHIILLIQSPSDVDALPSACQAIVAAGYEGCWNIVSPAIAVDQKTAAAKFDSEIEALCRAETDAASRGDYDAASSHKLSREGKILDRDKAVTDAWKSVTPEERSAAYQQKLAPLKSAFEGKLNSKVTVLQDHFAPENWIQMLNSLSGAWFKPFVHGQFVVAWPGAIPAMAVAAPMEPVVTPEPPKPTPTPPAVATPKKPSPVKVFASREEKLKSLRYFGLASEAKKAGVDVKGKKGPQIIAEILAAENQPVAV